MPALARADAVSEAWRIGARGAPSPRALDALLGGWVRAVEAWAADALRAARLSEGASVEAVARAFAARLDLASMPAPPDLREWTATGRPSMRAAVRAELGVLRAAGMPRGWLEDRLGLVTPGRWEARGLVDPRWAARADDVRVTPALGALGSPGGPTRGIDVVAAGPGEAVLRTWAEVGRGLIRTLSESATADLPRRVVEAASRGGRWEDLVGEILGMGARTRSHARLIARDQVARLNSAVTEEMHGQAGITHYKWEHSGDERVRDTHRAAATRDIGHGPGVYSWAEGAPDVGFYGEAGHPGKSGLCRCRARPVLAASVRAQWAAARA